MNTQSEWFRLLQPELKKHYFLNLQKILKNEYSSRIIYPKKENIFRALELTDYNDVKILVLAQDPFHGPNQANGLAFAVNDEIKNPPSLQNIFKEIEKEYGQKPTNSTLLGWAQQGVLLLNSCLTVEAGRPGSHQSIGWEIFTDKIIEILNIRDEPIVFFLWGSFARKKKHLIFNNRHLILETVHPSPLSAYNGFFGCNHFIKANNFLDSLGKPKIDWLNSGVNNDGK